jgi:hypothetical protein
MQGGKIAVGTTIAGCPLTDQDARSLAHPVLISDTGSHGYCLSAQSLTFELEEEMGSSHARSRGPLKLDLTGVGSGIYLLGWAIRSAAMAHGQSAWYWRRSLNARCR